MVRVKKSEGREPTPADEALANSARFIRLKAEIKERTAEADKLKPLIMGFLEEEGEEDDQGSLWFDLPTEINGISSMKRERRESTSVDADKTLSILQKKGLEKRCYRMEPVLDQDEVLRCAKEGLISKRELGQMFPPKVTWALVPTKS